jgi:hypothetical protein
LFHAKAVVSANGATTIHMPSITPSIAFHIWRRASIPSV